MPERKKTDEYGMVPRGDVAAATQLAFNPRSAKTPSIVPEIVAPPSSKNIIPRVIPAQPQAAAPVSAEGLGRSAREFIGETVGGAVNAGSAVAGAAGRAAAPIAAFGSGLFGAEPAQQQQQPTAPAPAPAARQAPAAAPVARPSIIPADVQAALKSNAPGTAVISGTRQNGERIDRVYSRDELNALANRNVIPSESFVNPGAGVALSQATGGRQTLGLGETGRRNTEIAQAQARNQATRDRIAANSIVPRITEDDKKRQSTIDSLTTDARNAIDAGKRRTAGSIVGLINSYSGAQNQGRSIVPQAPRAIGGDAAQQPTALDQARLATESAQARAAQISAEQAQQVYALQQQLLSAPEGEREALQSQLEALTGRYRPQQRQQNGEITNRDRYANLGKLIANELDPDQRAKLIQEQKALESGAQKPAAPPGSKQIGTSGGVPVYEDENGNRFTL